MEPNDRLFDEIHHYLTQQMTETERQVFEATLRADATRQQEVSLQRQIRAGFKVLGYRQTLTDIQAELSQAGQLWQPDQQPSATIPANAPGTRIPLDVEHQFNWKAYAVAACVVLTLGLGWLFYKTSTEPPPTVARQSAPPPTAVPPAIPEPQASLPPPPVVSPAEVKPNLASRYTALADRYFDPTLRLATTRPTRMERDGAAQINEQETITQHTQPDTTAIRTGVQLLKRGKIRSAITALKPGINIPLPDWQANARWFLALAYLKDQQPRQAREQLQALANGAPNPYTQNARQVLQALKTKY